jgi:hypothetical protein
MLQFLYNNGQLPKIVCRGEIFLFVGIETLHQSHLGVIDEIDNLFAFRGVAVHFGHYLLGVGYCKSFLEDVTVDVLNGVDGLLREASAV